MPQKERTSGFAKSLQKANRVMLDYKQTLMANEGMTNLQPTVGAVLIPLLQEEGQTLSHLAKRAKMKAPTITVIANRLEERGWIRRKRSKHDRRQVRLYLTKKGRRQAEILNKVRARVFRKMFAGVDKETMTVAIEILNLGIDNIEGNIN